MELIVGDSEIWLDGPVSDWEENTGGLGSWVGFIVDDVDSVYERLASAGVELATPRPARQWCEGASSDPLGRYRLVVEAEVVVGFLPVAVQVIEDGVDLAALFGACVSGLVNAPLQPAALRRKAALRG